MACGLGLAAALADNRFVKYSVVPHGVPMELALHCANEYTQLASFLPKVYNAYSNTFG